MTDTTIVALARDALWTTFYICLPMLGAALIVGLVISILQVATSIQDQTLSTVPKIAAVLAALLLSLNWIIHTMVAYTTRLLTNIPGLIG
jgi:flagellar biosynthetic protein FliQ